MGIVGTGPGQAQLVVRMPFADVMKAVPQFQGAADGDQVIEVLVEERCLMIGPRSGADDVQNDGRPVLRPKAEGLAAGLDVDAVQNAPAQIIILGTEDDDLPRELGFSFLILLPTA